jgi:hypothetical protein
VTIAGFWFVTIARFRFVMIARTEGYGLFRLRKNEFRAARSVRARL